MNMIYEDYVEKTIDVDRVHSVIKEAINMSPPGVDACPSVLNGLLEMRGKRYTQKLENLCDELEAYQGLPYYNSFPFGTKTDQPFREFVGIYFAKNKYKKTWRNVLDAAKSYCKKISKSNIPLEDEKNVLILTDHWDTQMFRKNYAVPFINYAHSCNITFIFLLVTDFGITRIPFIEPKFINSKLDRDLHIYGTEVDLAEKAIAKLYKSGEVRYHVHGSTWNRFNQGCEYILNFWENKYYYTSFDVTKHKWSNEEYFNPPYDKVGSIDEIPASALKAFASSVYDLSEIPADYVEEESFRSTLDSNTYEAKLFGKRFVWASALNEERFKRLDKAFKKLIVEIDNLPDVS